MRAARGISAGLLLLGAAALGGCGEGGVAGTLRSAGVGGTPDEFLVLPTRPLEMPTDMGALPPPAPGTANRVDRNPELEAVAGLTGSGRPPSVAGADGRALVARAGGADPAIRSRLAVEDADYRANNRGRLLERVFARDQERLIYRNMTLDAPLEFEALRAQGVTVPPASPRALEDRPVPEDPYRGLRQRGWRPLPPSVGAGS